jgi:hypothetical protein
MKRVDFKALWESRYPGGVPISHTFRHSYPDRWFRIHSLPDSKRYPEDENEWSIILERQNTIITDILGDGSPLFFVSGNYFPEGNNGLHEVDEVDSIKNFTFKTLDHIDLHKLWPHEYRNGDFFRPVFCDLTWLPHKFDHVLRDIALDNVRAFFVAVTSDSLVVPYDGGVDLILMDNETTQQYKSKYSDWLSKREDGL